MQTNCIMKLRANVVNTTTKLKLEKQELLKEGYKEEISKWNKKYKDLKKQITNG